MFTVDVKQQCNNNNIKSNIGPLKGNNASIDYGRLIFGQRKGSFSVRLESMTALKVWNVHKVQFHSKTLLIKPSFPPFFHIREISLVTPFWLSFVIALSKKTSSQRKSLCFSTRRVVLLKVDPQRRKGGKESREI